MQNIPFHEIANIFPLIHGKEFVDLKQDIKENGCIEPIVLYEGKILDGRNRFRACQEVGVSPQYVNYGGNDPVGYVLSLNLHRRHLNESQRAMVGAKIAQVEFGQNQHTAGSENLPTQAQAAEQLNISDRSIRTAKKVQEAGTPELIEAVEQGEISVSAAADVATIPKEEQAEVVAKGEKEILQKAKEIRTEKAKKRREENEELRRNTPAPLFTGKYNVVVLDPPWPMEKISRDVDTHMSVLDYPTMSEDDLAKMELPFDEHCHVFMWTTHKFLPMAFRLFNQWGVKYVCNFVWHKPGGFQPFNLPQYNCEFALYGRVGSPRFADTKAFNTCFQAPRGKHSEKPEEFYELLRRVCDGHKIDIFNRRKIEGFDVWGNESGDAA